MLSGLAVRALPAAAAPGPIRAPDRLASKRGSAPTRSTRVASSSLENDVFQQLNAIRVQHNLVPLTISIGLTASATQHTNEMATDGYFAHNSQDGTSFWKRIQQWYPESSFQYWAVGENLVWSSPDLDATGALELWMNSPEHRANILDPQWREIGVAAIHVAAAPGTYQGLPVTIIATDFGVRR